jgi:hypothetical protein
VLALALETCELMTRQPRCVDPGHRQAGLTEQEVYRFARGCDRVMRRIFAPGRPGALKAVMAPITLPLQHTWQQLRRSAQMQRALSDDMQQAYAASSERCDRDFSARAAAQAKRSCALCGAAEAVRGDFKACARCQRAFYCCKEHQRQHWSAEHKRACEPRQ